MSVRAAHGYYVRSLDEKPKHTQIEIDGLLLLLLIIFEFLRFSFINICPWVFRWCQRWNRCDDNRLWRCQHANWWRSKLGLALLVRWVIDDRNRIRRLAIGSTREELNWKYINRYILFIHWLNCWHLFRCNSKTLTIQSSATFNFANVFNCFSVQSQWLCRRLYRSICWPLHRRLSEFRLLCYTKACRRMMRLILVKIRFRTEG